MRGRSIIKLLKKHRYDANIIALGGVPSGMDEEREDTPDIFQWVVQETGLGYGHNTNVLNVQRWFEDYHVDSEIILQGIDGTLHEITGIRVVEKTKNPWRHIIEFTTKEYVHERA